MPNISNGLAIWEKLKKSMSEMANDLNILGHARILFYQAAVAFDAGASGITGLACRACLEAAFLGFLSRRWDDRGYWGLNLPMTLDGKIRAVTFEELIEGVRKTGVLAAKELKAARRVQFDGNLVAHFVPGREKGVARILSPEKHGVRVGEIVKLWIGSDDALRDLVDTASILSTLVKRMLYESRQHLTSLTKP